MDESSPIVVVTSCTSLKAVEEGQGPVPAERLYAGEQHRRLMRGIDTFRTAAGGRRLDLHILSAGHGLVRGERRLGFYDATFAGLGRRQIDLRATALDIPTDVGRLLAKPYSLALLLLGHDYVRAASLQPGTSLGGPTIAFGGAALARHLEGLPSLKVVPAGKAEARCFSCGLVGLKGELAARLLSLLAARPDLIGRVAEPEFDVLQLLDGAPRQTFQVAA